MKLSIPSLPSSIFSTIPIKQAIEKRKKPDLPKGSGGTDAPGNPVPDVGKGIGKDSPLPIPKDGPTPTVAAPSNVVKDIPQSIPTDAAIIASHLSKDMPTSVPKPGPTPTPALPAPSAITTTVTSTTTVFSSIVTTTVHHTETTTVTGTVSASASTPPEPIHAGDSLSGAALTNAILAQCPKTTSTLTSTVSVTPAPVTSMITQTAMSSASPVTITITSTVTPQADRAPTCSAVPEHTKKAGPAEIMAIVFGLITLALLVGMFILGRKCYQMRRAQRVWRKQVRNEGNELTEMNAGGVTVNTMAVHAARAALGQRVKDQLAKSFKRKEAWEK